VAQLGANVGPLLEDGGDDDERQNRRDDDKRVAVANSVACSDRRQPCCDDGCRRGSGVEGDLLFLVGDMEDGKGDSVAGTAPASIIAARIRVSFAEVSTSGIAAVAPITLPTSIPSTASVSLPVCRT